MREYLFRAKCIHESEYKGQLIYGFGVHNWDDDGIERAELYTPNGVFEVAPETVGQYTGLKDRNGKEIFEGNVVKGRWWKRGESHRHIGTVTYVMGAFMVRGIKQYIGMDDSLSPVYEVIGNRFDNPELLGEVRGNE